MVRVSKRMKTAKKNLNPNERYPLEDAVKKISAFPKVKFDETVELHFTLNVDPKNSEQMVRGTAILPHGSGKKVRTAVFCKGPQAEAAKAAGADFIGAQDLIDKVNGGFLDFDCAIATPDMMRDLSRLGRILGPRGLMPSPKSGTVTQDIEKAVKEAKAGKIEFKADKQAGIHVGIGKRSFSEEQLVANARHIIEAIDHAKPQSIKGVFLKNISLSTTMGPGIKVNI